MKNLKVLVIVGFLLPLFSSCDSLVNDETTNDSLYVKFINDSASLYTITTIEIRNRGAVDGSQEPIGTWSSNVLQAGQKLVPGESTYFTLKLPNGEWAEYRLGVDGGTGNEVMLYDQPNYNGFRDLPITHWGSDERTVSVAITYDETTNTISVTGWSDWSGIED
ncbi:hypothetical protein [Tenuifilum thalassicum]|uniref:Uncharacterized protein n=1 Tax=Tenuifilum thalassicum TaxID=2590900 RepID=A0A7D3XFL2_9BACT|nr:hypothetical protein [Tenuifilum thalassicum]QKG79477.1 hypothetical protein FHG85_04070 [Tenuifilum thalassicum]